MIDFGHGVGLGPLEPENQWAYFDWRNDSRIWKWCRQNDILQTWEHEQWWESLAERDDVRMYEIHSTATDGETEAVGVCGLTSLDLINSRAEFSLYIDPGQHMRGLGKKALTTLLDHGFKNYGLNLIWGETYDGNPAHKMFLDMGMRQDGTRRQFYFRNGKYIDAHLVSITRDEWLP